MTLRRSDTARALASASRLSLLGVLQDRGPQHVSDLVVATGLHPNTVREHLALLLDVDFIRCQPEVRTVRGRPRMIYRATSVADVVADPEALRRLEDGIAQARLAAAVMADQSAESDVPDARVSVPESASRDVLALEAHLDRIGFDPVYEPGEQTFHLWRCPFLALAKERQDVVCRIHVQLAQGVLDQVGGHHEIERLNPFVGHEYCTLTLRDRPAVAQRPTG